MAGAERRGRHPQAEIQGGSTPDRRYFYYPDTNEIPEASGARRLGSSFKSLADVEFSSETEGVIVSQGSLSGGYSLFVKDGDLRFMYNFLGIAPEQTLAVSAPAPGRHIVGVSFDKISISPQRKTLEFRTQSGHYALAGEGLAAGGDSADPVFREYASGFAFSGGRIHKVVKDVGDDTYVDLERPLGAILARD